VRTNQIELKLTKFFGRYGDIRERAKSCVYSVNNFATRYYVFNKARRFFDAIQCLPASATAAPSATPAVCSSVSDAPSISTTSPKAYLSR
jgi:hypothetical protein